MACNLCNRSLKSEFIGSFAFLTHPVIDHQFPRGLAPCRPSESLPVLDLLATQFLMGTEFPEDPLGAVFGGRCHGPIIQGKPTQAMREMGKWGGSSFIALSSLKIAEVGGYYY